ncbi:MAG TPA: DUF3160 domain-containing protein [Syntrophomonadaceae bacterium]|nr:DUF3160 domain-containing protein [Syntrophomonadaceae bacterium]
MMSSQWRVVGRMIFFLFLSASLVSGCSKTSINKAPLPSPQTALAGDFASYHDYPVNIQPAVPPYKVAADLSNVTNINRFSFSPQAQDLLVQNAFVVVPARGLEFFSMYEPNRYDGIPNFVTTDAMLHNYHLYFNHLLKSIEKEKLIPQLKELNTILLSQSTQDFAALQGTAWENAARRNLAFFAVGSRLLDPQVAIPSPVQAVVDQELSLINSHQGMEVSPVMNMSASQDIKEDLKEDYTQYIPRGHYTQSPELQNYFKSMMWYGRLTFRLKDEDETRSAALITLMLNQKDASQLWESIYQPTAFLVGKSDDLGYYQYGPLMKNIYGSQLSVQQVTGDESKWKDFVVQAQKLEPPALNSIPIFDANIQPDREKEIKGFRFMGQRFTLDASVFQRLIYREVKENPAGKRRMLPKGLDIPAAMGSTEAYQLLQSTGEDQYQNYPENMTKMKSYYAGLGQNQWTQNLYWNWLYTLLPLTTPKTAGYPSFMLNQAWTRKDLNCYLGNWTELKHDTILYTKQVYAEAGGGMGPTDDRGYVEPNPYLYGRLASLTAMTREGLANRSLLNNQDQDSLQRLEELALSLKSISEKELTNTALSDQDYELIRSFGAQLEHFWLEALRDDGLEGSSQLWDFQAPLVVDVATEPPDRVLEEATGHIFEIYAAVPVDGKLRIAKGGVYSYYEFSWPASNRLTDKEWQEKLAGDQAPQPPAWTADFTAQGLTRVIPSGQ